MDVDPRPDSVSDEILRVARALNGDVAELRAQLRVLSAGHDHRDVNAKVYSSLVSWCISGHLPTGVVLL